jgi:NNP family nitrate/nitrite transporter-like MFS transporter
MGCGATYAVTPFINRSGVGAVAGVVGAGGNAGAVAAGFLLKAHGVTASQGLFTLGLIVTAAAFLAPLVRFPEEVGTPAVDSMRDFEPFSLEQNAS